LLGNKQSQLLQQVKQTLAVTFPRTDLRADGQVVLAPFQSYDVEVVPAFALTDGTFITAHTAANGSWRGSNPAAEFQAIQDADSVSSGKATDLYKMLKAWKRECSVEIKSISLEVLACEFVKQWQHREQGLYWYDWLVRDFFQFMLSYQNEGWTRVPGTQEIIHLGGAWVSKAQTAYDRSLKACEYEGLDSEYAAAFEWQKILGQQFATKRLSLLELALAAHR